jgi:hypothetical protein
LTSWVKSVKLLPREAGIAQLVEHNLAKVGVASSNLVSRSKIEATKRRFFVKKVQKAVWQSGYAAACKAVDAGSIPASASKKDMPRWRNR